MADINFENYRDHIFCFLLMSNFEFELYLSKLV